MPLLYTDPLFLEHKTGHHPECPERLSRVLASIDESELNKRFTRPQFEAATGEQIARVHNSNYVQLVSKFAEKGGGRIEADTVVSPRSYDATRLACGAGVAAVDAVLSGDEIRAACLVRPPGHHALRHQAMGFCLFNNIAVAAGHAVEHHKLSRVLIVDWDVHHGNGTQATFYRSENVYFLSIHRHPFYPGTGTEDETGEGPGLGTTMNLPIEFGTSRDDYFSRFQIMIKDIAAQCRPELVLLSAGFDAHRLDPVGSLGLETHDYIMLTQQVADIANEYADRRLISFLEGGYNLEILPDCVRVHLETLAGDAEGI
ncbi:histone deacetylase [Symmachiella dynata]|uniref:histone deacetylase family protein n=1 Tax=Symmachiella dynata TaxID=2527995 RepID=UPI0030EFA37A